MLMEKERQRGKDRGGCNRDLGAVWEDMGGGVGGVGCLNSLRRPCVSRLPIRWEIRAQEDIRLPGKISISKLRDLTS